MVSIICLDITRYSLGYTITIYKFTVIQLISNRLKDEKMKLLYF